MSDRINAPWTDEQVKHLNAFQQCGLGHPFTCGGKKDGKDCRADLVATKDGWICPDGCGYTQDWAHTFMGDGRALEGMDAMLRKFRRASPEGQGEQSSGEPA